MYCRTKSEPRGKWEGIPSFRRASHLLRSVSRFLYVKIFFLYCLKVTSGLLSSAKAHKVFFLFSLRLTAAGWIACIPQSM